MKSNYLLKENSGPRS